MTYDKVKGQGHPIEKCNFSVLAWTFCSDFLSIFDISAYKGYILIHAHNVMHAHAKFVQAHVHARNNEKCA